MSKLIDVSHSIEEGMVTYPGLPTPLICDFLSREASTGHYGPGVQFCINRIDMVGNTGTYIDAPFHRYADGIDLKDLPLQSVTNLAAVVVRIPPQIRAVGHEFFETLAVTGKAVLVHTGWSRHWGTEGYFVGHPFLTESAAAYLKAQGAVLVGIDSLNIDDTEHPARPVHSILLGADIPIVEHLCHLDQLPDQGFRFHAAPIKLAGCGSFPVRAYGVTECETGGFGR